MATSNFQDTWMRMPDGRCCFGGICRECGQRSPYMRTAGMRDSWFGDHAEHVHGAVWPEVLHA